MQPPYADAISGKVRDTILAILVYTLLFLFLTVPFWALDETISPHRRFKELGVSDNTGSHLVENRKFSESTNAYIPEIHEHLTNGETGLKTWTSLNELGRPVYHTAGFSPVYLPSWVISRITDNPLRYLTVLSLAWCFLAGLFVILLCRDRGASPLGSVIAGVTVMGSPFMMYWLTVPMVPAVFCWTAGALWACNRISVRQDLVGWSILAFSLYSLLMTGYFQSVIFHCYILAGFGLYLGWHLRQRGWREVMQFFACGASAALAAGILVLPVFMDLVHAADESNEVLSDRSFLADALKLDTLADILRFIVLKGLPDLFGNPVEPGYPFLYDGFSVTPVVAFFAVFGLLTRFRKTWGWWLAVALACLMTFVPSVYLTVVKYLSFGLALAHPHPHPHPLSLAILPLAFIVASGADALIRRPAIGEAGEAGERVSAAFGIAAATVPVILAVGLAYALAQTIPVQWGTLLIHVAVAVLLAAQYRKASSTLLFGVLVIMLATVSPLILRQDPAKIATTSALAEKVRVHVPPGSRFAVAAPGVPVLPPNLNAELGIPSMHSANSLSSRRYHALIESLGGEMHAFGNSAISPEYDSTVFWMSNISLMLASTKLSHENLQYLGEESGIHMHEVISRMGDSMQVFGSPISLADVDGLQLGDPRLLSRRTPSKLVDTGDLLEFAVVPGVASVLVLSRKFHRDWQAQVSDGLSWRSSPVMPVNDVFLGVLLPKEVEQVRLEFKPAVRFGWVANVFWVLLLLFVPLWTLWQARSRRGAHGSGHEIPAAG